MAFFKKTESLAVLIARLRDSPPTDSAELTALVERVTSHEDCRPQALAWFATHPASRLRAVGVAWLSTRLDTRVVEALLRELPGKPAAVRDEVARLIFLADARGVVDAAIGPLIHAEAVEQREAALSLIAAHPTWHRHLSALKVALADPVVALRLAAIRILCGGVKDDAVHVILLNLLRDEDPGVRRLVINALTQEPRPEAVEALLNCLASEGLEEQALIVQALQRLADNPAARLVERLMPVLADEDEHVRAAAVRLLGRLPNAAEILRAFLVYSRGLAFWLRDRATVSIMEVSADIVEPLVSLMSDPEEDIRIGAIAMASSCADPRIVPRALEIFLGNEDWWVRSIAAEALGNFPSPENTQALLSRLDDPDLRATVIAVLGKMQSREAVCCLIDCLEDPGRGTRMATLEALAPIKSPEAVAALQRLALEDPDPALRDKARAILESQGADVTSCQDAAGAVRASGAVPATHDAEPDLTMENEALRTGA